MFKYIKRKNLLNYLFKNSETLREALDARSMRGTTE